MGAGSLDGLPYRRRLPFTSAPWRIRSTRWRAGSSHRFDGPGASLASERSCGYLSVTSGAPRRGNERGPVEGGDGLALASGGGVHPRAQGLDGLHGALDPQTVAERCATGRGGVTGLRRSCPADNVPVEPERSLARPPPAPLLHGGQLALARAQCEVLCRVGPVLGELLDGPQLVLPRPHLV